MKISFMEEKFCYALVGNMSYMYVEDIAILLSTGKSNYFFF